MHTHWLTHMICVMLHLPWRHHLSVRWAAVGHIQGSNSSRLHNATLLQRFSHLLRGSWIPTWHCEESLTWPTSIISTYIVTLCWTLKPQSSWYQKARFVRLVSPSYPTKKLEGLMSQLRGWILFFPTSSVLCLWQYQFKVVSCSSTNSCWT